jgi:hypothetical protein
MRIHTPREIALRIAEDASILGERLAFARRGAGVPEAAPRDDFCNPPVSLFRAFAEREAAVAWIKGRLPRAVDETIATADGVLANRIPLFSRICEFADPIDWHLECASGIRVEQRFYRDIDFLDAGSVGDKKFIWELNRHNYFMFLGKAYWFSGDWRYLEKWKADIRSWIAANPYNVGVNWASSLELAIRIVNWIWSSWFFMDELREDRAFLSELCRAIRLQATHVERHLSYVFSPNTHLTGEALGLLYAGSAFPFMERAGRWVALGNRILEMELPKQILDDGGYFEMATYYHKYTIDFYLHYLLLNGGPERVDPAVVSRIRLMIFHLLSLAEPDGTIPLLGDSDGGQLLFFNLAKNNIRASCAAAAALLADGAMKSLCGPGDSEELVWLLGMAGAERYRSLPETQPVSYHSINHETGFFRFRTGPGAQETSLLIDCGPHGWKGCGHAHSDLLSFEWISRGTKVVVDPGTYTYTGSKIVRDRSRMSQSHNTITIDDQSQSTPGAWFKWKTIARPTYAHALSAGETGFFEGEHDAYEKLGCRHQRSVVFFGDDLSFVIDLLMFEREASSVLVNVQCGVGELAALDEGLFRFVGARGGSPSYIRVFHPPGLGASVANGEIYPDYGSAVSAPRLELTGQGVHGNLKIVTALVGDEGLARALRLDGEGRLTAAGGGRAYALDVGALEYAPLCRRIDSALSAFAERARGTVLCARGANAVRGPDGETAYEGPGIGSVLIRCSPDGTVAMATDAEPPGEFELRCPIQNLFVNGLRRDFTRTGRVVRVRS